MRQAGFNCLHRAPHRYFGADNVTFTVGSEYAPVLLAPRTYGSFSDASMEVGRSRWDVPPVCSCCQCAQCDLNSVLLFSRMPDLQAGACLSSGCTVGFTCPSPATTGRQSAKRLGTRFLTTSLLPCMRCMGRARLRQQCAP